MGAPWLAGASMGPGSLPDPCVGSSQNLGPTWGPEVLCVHTFLMDFCRRRGAGCGRKGEREKVRPGAHCTSVGMGVMTERRGGVHRVTERVEAGGMGELEGHVGWGPGPCLPSSWASSEAGAAGSTRERGNKDSH